VQIRAAGWSGSGGWWGVQGAVGTAQATWWLQDGPERGFGLATAEPQQRGPGGVSDAPAGIPARWPMGGVWSGR